MTPETMAQLEADLERDESNRAFPYDDATGQSVPPGGALRGKLTIGVGRNLTDRGLSPAECEFLLKNDLARVQVALDQYLPWWRQLSSDRQRALANLAFNLGVGPSLEDPKGKLLQFTRTLVALEQGDWAAVDAGLAASLWAKQVGPRADRIRKLFNGG